jgi:hypothetical protein
MKIRIKGNTLRYRLTKSDVSALGTNGYLQEKTDFAGRPLYYSLKSTGEKELSASFMDNNITLFVPNKMVVELTNTDTVGFENECGQLKLLVEKDFTCLDNVDEDQSDNYPNPLALQKN